MATRLVWAVVGALLCGAAVGAPLRTLADEVPYVQTPSNVVDAMLAIADVGPKDFVVDLGSGDGRIVIAAATRYGARGLGIDYDATLIAESRANAALAGVSDRVRFLQQDIFLADFRDATVVTMYLLPEVNLEIRPQVLFGLRPGTRVVSHDWDMGEWEPDRRIVVPAPEKIVGVKKESTIHLWVVPARVAGYWRGTLTGPAGEESVVIEFAQRFQNTSANVWLRQWTLPGGGRLHGNDLSLTLDWSPWKPDVPPLALAVRISGSRMEGDARHGDERYVLRATRLAE